MLRQVPVDHNFLTTLMGHNKCDVFEESFTFTAPFSLLKCKYIDGVIDLTVGKRR